MYLNVSTGNNAIFQKHKTQKFSYILMMTQGYFDHRTPPDGHAY
jgi:hypothetical protein